MSAKQKLDRAVFWSSAGLAAVVGAVAQSWWVFGAVLVVTLAAAVVNREIRLGLARRRVWRGPAHR